MAAPNRSVRRVVGTADLGDEGGLEADAEPVYEAGGQMGSRSG